MVIKKTETIVTPEVEKNQDKTPVTVTVSREELYRRHMSPSMITKMEEAKYPREIRVPLTMTDPHPEASIHQDFDVAKGRYIGPMAYGNDSVVEVKEPFQHQDPSDPAYPNRDPAKITRIVPTDKDVPDAKKASDPVNLDRDPKFLVPGGHIESVVVAKKDTDVVAKSTVHDTKPTPKVVEKDLVKPAVHDPFVAKKF